MKQILCFGDSNTWGLIPKTGERFPWGIRWTSILSEKLGQDKYHIVEEGLCGRTTVFDDPLRDGRCGVKVLPTLLESHAPIDLSIIMLGTNDCKTVYGASSDVIGKGVARLVKQVRRFAPTSKVLVISPIHLGQQVWEDELDPEFSHHSVDVSKGLAEAYCKVSHEEHTAFLDASQFAEPSETDREHLSAEGHAQLAEAVFKKVKEII